MMTKPTAHSVCLDPFHHVPVADTTVEREQGGVRPRRLVEFPLAMIGVLLLLVISMDVFTFRHDDQALAAAAEELAAPGGAPPDIDGVEVWVSPSHVCLTRPGRSLSGLLSPILGRVEHRAIAPLSELSGGSGPRESSGAEKKWGWCPSSDR